MPLSKESDATNQSVKTMMDSRKVNSSRGIQNFIHGNLFQVKLTLHYGLYAWEKTENKKNFGIANEMPNGGILDDLVVATKKEDGTNVISIFFLQAKHSNDGKTISYADVIKETSASQHPFSITDFYKSYKLIKADPIYSAFAFDKCYLCSNATLNAKMKEISLRVTDGNEFFTQESGELWKINSQSSNISELRNKLKKTTDFTTLIEKLLNCVRNKTKIVETNGIFSIYHVALIKEKIITKNEFHSDFIDDNNLSTNAKEFRRKFFEMYEEAESLEHEEAKNKLKDMRMNISAKFGKIPKVSSLDSLDSNGFARELFKLVKKNAKNSSSIKYNKNENGRRGRSGSNQIDLLSQYVFVYANNKKTLKFRSKFFDGDFIDIVNKLDPGNNDKAKKMLQMFKDRFLKFCKNGNISHAVLKRCRFKLETYVSVYENESVTMPPNENTTDAEINQFFEDFYFAVNQPNENKISELIGKKLCEIYKISDPTLVSSFLFEKTVNWIKDKTKGCLDGVEISEMINHGKYLLEKVGMRTVTKLYRKKINCYGNDHKLIPLKEFLNNTQKKILWIRSPEPFAVATTVPATLKLIDKEKFSKSDNYIMSSLSSLLYVQKETLLAYKHVAAKDVPLIIVDENELEKKDEKNNIISFAQNILNAVECDENKKLVIISKPNSVFAKEFENYFSTNKQYATKCDISFKDYSNKKSAKLIKFQGEWISVRQLIKKNKIDALMLKKLMTDKKVTIGKPINGSSKVIQRATYKKNGIYVIELSCKDSVRLILKNKAAEMKRKKPDFWIASLNLKTLINKRARKSHKSLPPRLFLSKSLKNEYSSPVAFSQEIFEYLHKMQQIILVIDGFEKITQKDIGKAIELLDFLKANAHEVWIVMNKTFSRQIVPPGSTYQRPPYRLR